jgi:tetratricopeptide (TPR) repeat protein
MAKKKKSRSFQSILARAEKLFDRGNYPLAKEEFEKVLRGVVASGPEVAGMVERTDIAKKIEICTKKAEKLKAEDLVKRAKKYARKSNPRQALRCFEDAYEISGEDWIREKIDRLQVVLLGRDATNRARDAEAAGEHVKAAKLYEEAFATHKREDILLKKACCLVKAKKYNEAIQVFQDLSLSHPCDMYNYGFALAKEGRYYECLKVWDGIDLQPDGFLEQREAVRSMLAVDLHDRLEIAKDFASIYEQGQYLLNSANGQGPGHDIDSLVEYSKYGRIEELWKEERFETIAELLRHSHNGMCPDMLALQARICFKLAETSERHLADLAMFWLTAVYGEIFAKCSSGMKEADNVRQKLVHLAEDLIKKHADSGDVARKSTLVCWNIEKRLVEDLYALVGNRQDFSHLVCTPRFAMRFGRSAEVLRLIRKNRGFFKNREHYLLTGTYYSLAGESLFCIENRDYDKALAVLPDEGHDEFVDYGVRRVKFAYGLYCLEQGESWPGRYLESAMALFDIAPEYERALIDKAMSVVGLNEQRCYEEALTEIHKRRPSRGIKDALSLIMSSRAIDMYNQEQINDKTLDTILRKALALNPKNEHAIGNLNDTQVELQRTELAKALKRHKMNKACKIAAETENREVRDEFFEFFEYTVKSLDKMEMEDKEKTFLLKDFYGWCARVDESHPVLYDIGHMLDQLELR